MYKLNTLLCTILLGAALLTSCKKDEVIPVEENHFTFNGQRYDLRTAFGREYDNGPGATVGYSLVMISDAGSESVMLLFNVPDGTIEGNYLPTTTSGEEPNTFTGARIEIGYNPVTEESGQVFRNNNTPGGQINITKSGNDYIVKFDVVLDEGENAKGHYKGAVINQ
jgi:hypothetical protein